MLDRRSRSHIERELDQIERLMREYSELLAVSSEKEPELIARTALGAVFQSFYNGVENIFQTVAKWVDQDVPAGVDWHRQLLQEDLIDFPAWPPPRLACPPCRTNLGSLPPARESPEACRPPCGHRPRLQKPFLRSPAAINSR